MTGLTGSSQTSSDRRMESSTSRNVGAISEKGPKCSEMLLMIRRARHLSCA